MQKERAKIAKELTEKLNTIKDLPPAEREKETLKLKPLENCLVQQDAKLADFKLKVQKTEEIKVTADKVIEERDKENKKNRETQKEIEKEIEKHKETNPQKYNQIKDFADLYNDQTATINKIDLPEKPVTTQKESPATQKVASSTQLDNIKESHTIGDRIVDLNAQLKSRPALKGEIEKIASELKIGLQNQKNTSVNSKENEVNKQMARTAQQNKDPKNKGHGR
ncbi:MAG: hypothetical protein LN573_03745 [Rickettsia endosymbiont of Oxypoda opaca]|nr:hypothetical protein [Rickettsia endosymbiont of Oxypoda opaca]